VLKHRLTFGPILIVLIAVIAWLDAWIDVQPAPQALPGGTWPPGVLVFLTLAVLGGMGAREVARILRTKGVAVGTGIAIAVQLFGLIAVALIPVDSGPDTIGLAAAFSTVVIAHIVGVLYAVRDRTVEGAIAVGSGVLMIHVYLGLMLGFLLLIRREHSVWILIWILASVKSCDIGAFATGKTIGKHKLIPWLSPGKTWEGLIGGLITSGLVAVAGAWILRESGIWAPSLMLAGIIGVALGALGQCGDLAASLLKRDAGVKDAGTSLPGFGGVLDVLDSPILVGPFAYWALQFAYGAGAASTGAG